jgi:hypothetical protein
MYLLPTQKDQLREIVEGHRWPRSDFTVDESSGNPAVSIGRGTWRAQFKISGGPENYDLWYSPGPSAHEERVGVSGWSAVIQYFTQWLGYARRELTAFEGAPPDATPPDWVPAQLPAEYQELQAKRATIEARLTTIDEMAALLWQQSDPLTRAVVRVFQAAGFDAALTASGATYDVTVTASGVDGRLLIEVRGVDGAVNKSSRKIGQILDAVQHEQQGKDRVILALNAHRTAPPEDRQKLEVVTADALRLLSRLDAVILPTPILFKVWLTAERDQHAAATELRRLWTEPAGIFVSSF